MNSCATTTSMRVNFSTQRSRSSVATSMAPPVEDHSSGTRLSSSEHLKVCGKRRDDQTLVLFRTPRSSQATFRQSRLQSSILRQVRHSLGIESRTIVFPGLQRVMPNISLHRITRVQTTIAVSRILSIIQTQ